VTAIFGLEIVEGIKVKNMEYADIGSSEIQPHTVRTKDVRRSFYTNHARDDMIMLLRTVLKAKRRGLMNHG
jgi:hypothetical protein